MEAQPSRILVSHAAPEAYAPMTRAILSKLGYSIMQPDEYEVYLDEAAVDEPTPALRIVDERQLAEVPDEYQPIPIVVITGRHGVTGADPRIVGALRRPAGMHELYRLVQQVTEETPRSTPRVPTHLPARCRKGDRQWASTVLSLSENGCLVRTPEPLTLGTHIDLSFELPRIGRLEVDAEAAYQLLPDLGLIFHATDARHREAIADFVSSSLTR
jgi:hypothetical protein